MGLRLRGGLKGDAGTDADADGMGLLANARMAAAHALPPLSLIMPVLLALLRLLLLLSLLRLAVDDEGLLR